VRRVDKPWGHEEIWAETPHYVGKVLVLKAGHRLSLQHHERKTESLRVQRGELELELDDDRGILRKSRKKAGESWHVAPGRKHRFTAVTDVELVEVSTPELDDVVRHEDDYGRS
jgi:mannose-6-phosphate isomerase-like protein (cupin superfamily)